MRPERRLADQIDETGRALAAALGSRVACIALYGSAAGEDFSPLHSDVNLLVVLHEVAFRDLRLIGDMLERRAASGGLRFATPLVVRPEFLRAARDSFPIELEDMRTRHRVLAGDDLVAGLTVSTAALHVAAERELRTMLLRLHALGVHRPSDDAVCDALSHLGASFSIVGTALLDLPTGAARPRAAALLAELSTRLRVGLAAFAGLLALREGTRAWPREDELDRLLEALTVELDAIVQAIDARRI